MIAQENEKDSPECNQYMYAGQHVIQRLLLLSALVCIPWMLFAKPFVLKREAAAKPGQHFDFVEVMIHQGTDRSCAVLSVVDPDPDRYRNPEVFLGLPDPNPYIIKQKSWENLDFYCFVTSL
jgi:hypothetical protein